MISLDTMCALAALTPMQREILLDVALVGLTAPAIEKRDGLSPNAVADTLYRIRRGPHAQALEETIVAVAPDRVRVPVDRPTLRRELSVEERVGLRRLVDARVRDRLAESEFERHICVRCGGDFVPRHPAQRYCSRPCRDAAQWERDKARRDSC